MKENVASLDPPEFEVDLDTVAHGGAMIGRTDGQVVFVPYALPGERARVRVVSAKRDFAKAELTDLLRPAPGRVQPRCPYFGSCGGCSWQHADYALQLELKRGVVVDQLSRIGGFADADELVRQPIGMVEPWDYRNHVRF